MLKKTEKKKLIIFYLSYNLLLLKLSLLEAAAINRQENEETQRLNSEFSKVLANDVAGKDGIVQPFWTLDKSDQTQAAKFQITEQNRNEAAALRDEIEQALSKYSNAIDGAIEDQNIKILMESLKEDKEELLSTERKENNTKAAQDEHLGDTVFNQNHQKSISRAPNRISANLHEDDIELDERKLEHLEISKRRTREVLVVKYIEEDFAFDLGAEVNEWKHIVHAGQEYFIGRQITDLLLVRKIADKYERAMVVEIGHVINYMESYTYWNVEQEQNEGVILIAAANKVLWYRANHETKLIELYWEWLVDNIITELTHFNLDSNNYLTITSNQSVLAEHYALNIYQYNLEAKEFWIAQSLQLEFPSKEVTVLDTGRDVILATAQNNTAKIYTFNPHEADFAHIHFQLKISVEAEGIYTISGFKMGGHSYLALTGYHPQILFYQQGDFISKTFLDRSFGWVELFFPIPLRTYRDDLILLVQHRVDFSTHNLTVVETLIWDGEAFETSIPVPCHLGKHVVYGVGCMLDLHRDEGLKGAALLKRGEEVSVIVPRYKAESGLFRFHTELLAKNSEVKDLQEIFNFLKEQVKELDDLVAEAEAFLQLPNEDIIETLKTPEFESYGKVEEIYLNDFKWTEEDSELDLVLIIQNIEELKKSLNSDTQDELVFDEVEVENLEVEKVNAEHYFIQNLNNLTDFFENLLYKNNSARFTGNNTFTGLISIDFNGLDLEDLFKNIALVNQTEPIIIKGLITCKDVIHAKDTQIKKSLIVGHLSGCSLAEWLNNTLRKHKDVNITHLVNFAPNLTIRGMVDNSQNLSDVGTLEEVVESPLYFESISTTQVYSKDLVSGINLTTWFENAVKSQNPFTQYINGNWSVKTLTVRPGPKQFKILMKGLEPWLYKFCISLKRKEINKALNDELCALVKEILQTIAKKPVFIKHIEECFNMDLGNEFKNRNENLNKIFDVKSQQEHFLVINLKCESLIYKWLITEEKFIYKTSFESGPINEIDIIPSYNKSNKLQFITSFEATENIDSDLKGLKKWKVVNDTIVLEDDLPGSLDLYYRTEGNYTSLWTLYNETIEELDLDYKIKQKWQLPVKENQTRYRFVPLKEEQEILLTNGEQIVFISKNLAKISTKSLFNSQEPASHLNTLQFGQTELYNKTIRELLIFNESKLVIEDILADLKQSLNRQINITQLSIPETDLFDEDLIPDFLSIMEELKNQNIFNSKVLNISFNNIQLPQNPSQVLAARIVQITWPVAMKLEKLLTSSKSNESEVQYLYKCIAKSLGFLINDVLMLANEENNSKHETKLNNVIERIRKFEKNLNDFLEAYTSYYDTQDEMKYTEQEEKLKESAPNLDLNLFSQNQSDIIVINNTFLPGYKKGEILPLLVGNVSNPQHLWAVTNTNSALTNHNNAGINIYWKSIKSQLYQVISAIQPKSLQQLRIKQETLLLYVEECCQVKIWKYHGNQKFTAFAEINRNETIKQILTISVPSHQGNFKYFLILLLEGDVKFYEFIVEGYDLISDLSAFPILPNCL